MYGQQPKKMMILCILEIMKKYTDEQHRLSQKEVMDLLEKKYEMQVDRKSVKANLEDLMEFDSHINCSTMVRK
ncbi:MAG: WYL domain-containing protein, partial [Oscillospiraceae bacterium]|nr:WYL domain-containing protein [Oscillospiraceae bacterium]